MKLVKLKTWWCGLVINIKNFEFKFGGNCMNRTYLEQDNNGNNFAVTIPDIDIPDIDISKVKVIVPEVQEIISEIIDIPDVEVIIPDIVVGEPIDEEDINISDIDDE